MVTELDPAYLSTLAQNFGFLGAFLGGVSATVCVTLLTLTQPSNPSRWAVGLAALAAEGFIVTAALSMTVVAQSHPQAPAFIARQASSFERLGLVFAFTIGVYSLLAAIGVSGWIRSRVLGMCMTAIALAAAIPITVNYFF